jgi:hypothetical protein
LQTCTPAGSALLFQALAIRLSPMRYMRLVASLNLVAVLAMLWALWAPSVSGGQRGGWQEAAAVAECRVRCMHCPPRDMHLACHPQIVASPADQRGDDLFHCRPGWVVAGHLKLCVPRP